MTAAAEAVLFATIWLSVALFVAGEIGKRRSLLAGAQRLTAWRLWAAGAVLCFVHIILAMALRHRWSHQSAIDATAEQTLRVYGVHWGGGVYVNYLFLATWAGELLWWRLDPHGYFHRPLAVTWLVRSFYLTILANAAIVFAAPGRRLAGLGLLAILIWAWRPAAARAHA
jgi:hypothetical protein